MSNLYYETIAFSIIIFSFGIIPVYAQSTLEINVISDDPEIRLMQIEKIQNENKKLELENQQLQLAFEKSQMPSEGISENMWGIIIQVVSTIGVIGASVYGFFWKWKQIKMIPPLGEQEKFFRQLAKSSLHECYKEQWDVLEKEIRNIDDSEKKKKKIEEVWKVISQRDFPKTLKDKVHENWKQKLAKMVQTYHLENLKGNQKQLESFATTLVSSVHSEYFDMVNDKLPKLVEKLTEQQFMKIKTLESYEERKKQWISRSKDKIKYHMIMNGLSQYEEIVFTEIESNISKKLDRIEEKAYSITIDNKPRKGAEAFTDEIREKLSKDENWEEFLIENAKDDEVSLDLVFNPSKAKIK